MALRLQFQIMNRWIAIFTAFAFLSKLFAAETGAVGKGPEHWSLKPLNVVEPPSVAQSNWAKSPIDLFVLEALQKRQLSPAPEADKRDLIRRVYFDLAGLTPTPEEVRAFLDDMRPAPYERVIEDLL